MTEDTGASLAGPGSRPSDEALRSSPEASIPSAGSVFIQTGIPYTVETAYEWVGDGFGARQEPMREYWQIGRRETQYGEVSDGEGRFELHVLEVIETMTSGKVAIYERRWFDPDGDLISRPRKRYAKIGNLKAVISRRKMQPAQAIEAGTVETNGLDPKDESAVGTMRPNTVRIPQ